MGVILTDRDTRDTETTHHQKKVFVWTTGHGQFLTWMYHVCVFWLWLVVPNLLCSVCCEVHFSSTNVILDSFVDLVNLNKEIKKKRVISLIFLWSYPLLTHHKNDTQRRSEQNPKESLTVTKIVLMHIPINCCLNRKFMCVNQIFYKYFIDHRKKKNVHTDKQNSKKSVA